MTHLHSAGTPQSVHYPLHIFPRVTVGEYSLLKPSSQQLGLLQWPLHLPVRAFEDVALVLEYSFSGVHEIVVGSHDFGEPPVSVRGSV
jgi:hypothetical protein